MGSGEHAGPVEDEGTRLADDGRGRGQQVTTVGGARVHVKGDRHTGGPQAVDVVDDSRWNGSLSPTKVTVGGRPSSSVARAGAAYAHLVTM